MPGKKQQTNINAHQLIGFEGFSSPCCQINAPPFASWPPGITNPNQAANVNTTWKAPRTRQSFVNEVQFQTFGSGLICINFKFNDYPCFDGDNGIKHPLLKIARSNSLIRINNPKHSKKPFISGLRGSLFGSLHSCLADLLDPSTPSMVSTPSCITSRQHCYNNANSKKAAGRSS